MIKSSYHEMKEPPLRPRSQVGEEEGGVVLFVHQFSLNYSPSTSEGLLNPLLGYS